MNDKTKLEIFERMLVMLKKDRDFSIRTNLTLSGICPICLNSSADITGINLRISEFPELIALKPRGKGLNEYWWKINNTSMIRINKMNKVINNLKDKINNGK